MRARGGAVDLVGQDHVGEERAGLENKLARGCVVDARSQDVRREQVGSELDSPERTVDTGGDGPGQQCLAHAGHVLDQHVSLGQEGDDGEPDHFGLPQDHESDVFNQSIREGKKFVEVSNRRFSDLGRIHAVRSTDGSMRLVQPWSYAHEFTINHRRTDSNGWMDVPSQVRCRGGSRTTGHYTEGCTRCRRGSELMAGGEFKVLILAGRLD